MEEVIPCFSRLVPVEELAKLTGLTPKYIIHRFKKGCRDERLLEKKYASYHRGEPKVPEVPEYTEEELWELYKGFANNIEEQTILADFMGRERNDPEVIITLATLRARYWRER